MNNPNPKTKSCDIADDAFIAIYTALENNYASTDTPFSLAEAVAVAVNGKATESDLNEFITAHCIRADENDDSDKWRLTESASVRARQIMPEENGEAEEAPEVVVIPPPPPPSGDMHRRPDGLPHLRDMPPSGAAAPGIGNLSLSPAAVALPPNVSPPPAPAVDLEQQARDMEPDQLLRAYGHYRRVADAARMEVARKVLATHADLPNNPFYEPPRAEFDGVEYVSVAHLARRFYYTNHDEVFLDARTYNSVRANASYNLVPFCQALVNRKLQTNMKWEPEINGAPHNVTVIISESRDDCVFVKCTPKQKR